MCKRGWFLLVCLCACLIQGFAYAEDAADPRAVLIEAVRPGVTLSIDKGCGATYYHAETVNLTIRSQLSGYLTVYDFAPDGTVQQIFPNAYCPDNRVIGGETYTIPGNLLPFVFRVAPPDGTEVFFVVVTSDSSELVAPALLPDSASSRSPFPLISRSTESAVASIVGALSVVPADVRVAAAVCEFTIAPQKPETPVAEPAPAPAPTPAPTPLPNASPAASFTCSGPQGSTFYAGDTLRFDASGSSDSDGQITAYAWDWTSDGSIESSGASPSAEHVFATSGSYRVTLRVTDDDVATATTTQMISVTTAPISLPAPAEGKTYALFVAISDYAGTVNDLEYPVSQNITTAVRSALSPWIDSSKTLSDSQATRAGILSAIRAFLGQAGGNDSVYFHFAGHGTHVRDTNGDEPDGYDEAISAYDGLILDDELIPAFQSLSAGRAVLVYESCYGGGMDRGLGGYDVYTLRSASRDATYVGGTIFDELANSTLGPGGPSTLVLEACGANESAAYMVAADGVSYFARALVLALTEFSSLADKDSDGWVSLQEAFEFAAPLVTEAVRRKSGDVQTPQIHDGIGKPVQAVEAE
jgi:hypothetical protein